MTTDAAKTEDVALTGQRRHYTLTICGDDTISLIDRRPYGDGIHSHSKSVRLVFSDDPEDAQSSSFCVDDFDGIVSLGRDEMDSLAELYIAYLNRAPDAFGLCFWGDKLAQGMRMREIAARFCDQPEPKALYGEHTSSAEIVRAVYWNVFGRPPNTDEFRSWVIALQSETGITPATFIMDLLEGAKAQTIRAMDTQFLADKVALGIHFSVTRGLSNVQTARAVMHQFDGSHGSFGRAVAEIEAAFAEARDPFGDKEEFIIQLVGADVDTDIENADETARDDQFQQFS